MREQAPWVAENLHQTNQQAKATEKFFKQLKSGKAIKKLDDAFHEAHFEVFAERECLECANCCRTTSPIFRDVDVQRLSKHLRMNAADFTEKYLRTDNDGDLILQTAPCPFLADDHYCLVYDHRPKACRDYPHTDRKNMHQVLELTEVNHSICPAVAEIVEKLRVAHQPDSKRKG